MTAAQDARLDAIATVRLVLAGDTATADQMIRSTNDPAELASAACSLAAAVLQLAGEEDVVAHILDELTQAALRE